MKLLPTKKDRLEKQIRQNKEEIEYYKQKILLLELDIINNEKKLNQL